VRRRRASRCRHRRRATAKLPPTSRCRANATAAASALLQPRCRCRGVNPASRRQASADVALARCRHRRPGTGIFQPLAAVEALAV